MERVKMTQEDREHFKKAVKELCGFELLVVGNVINDKDMEERIAPQDLEFMNKTLGRQAGEIFSRVLRGFKKMDLEAVKEALRGKRGGSS